MPSELALSVKVPETKVPAFLPSERQVVMFDVGVWSISRLDSVCGFPDISRGQIEDLRCEPPIRLTTVTWCVRSKMFIKKG